MVRPVLLFALLLLAPTRAQPPATDRIIWPNDLAEKDWPVLYEGPIRGAKSLCLNVGPGAPATVAATVEASFADAGATVWDPFEKSVQALDISSPDHGAQAVPQSPPPSAGAANSGPALPGEGSGPQPPGNALPLLREIADAARATKTWLAVGNVTTQTVEEFSETTTVEPFKLVRDGLKWRYEVTGGPNARIQISDGAKFWEAYQPAREYTERGPEAGVVRVPPVLFWDYLSETLPLGMLDGEDNVELNGVSQHCEIVRGEAQGGEHSLCIDRGRKLVLRDRTASSSRGSSTIRTIRTITFSTIERDPRLSPDALRFRPPVQAVVRPVATAIPPPPLRAGVFAVGGNGVTPPTLLKKVEPEYSEQARQAKLSGTVVLYLEVGPDGLAHNIRVQRGVGMGLDEKAIEAVKKWRFSPGKKDGKPATVASTIEIDFKLL